jgi:chromate transporter
MPGVHQDGVHDIRRWVCHAPLITEELVDRRQWISQGRLLEILAVAQALPGSLSINISILVGYEIAGVPGALGAVAGAAFPPFLTITIFAALFKGLKATRWSMRLSWVSAARSLR